MTQPILSVQGLCVSAQTTETPQPLVRDVSFDIQQGETVVLIGASGSGKSLTLRSIPRIFYGNIFIEKGTILFQEKNLTALSESQMRLIRGAQIATVFQEAGASFNPIQRIGKQLLEAWIIHRRGTLKEGNSYICTLLEKSGFQNVDSILRAYPHELSGGMQQRIAIAMALSAKPLLLLADEPTSSLDGVAENQMLSILQEFKNRFSFSCMLISHNLRLVQAIADRILVFSQGRIIEQGQTYSILKHPQHPITQRLVKAGLCTTGEGAFT